MRDLLVIIIILAFILPGLTRPYLAFAGYLWVDTVVPQGLVFGFLSGQPISMIMAIVCFLSLFLSSNKLIFPTSKLVPFLFVFFIIWITISTFNAQFPSIAWNKWDTAFKTLVMAFLLMFTITTRKQLEFIILVLFCSIMFYIASAGPKTILGGGGYGARLILNSSNSGWSESSSLACLAVLVIPIISYLKKHISFLPFLKNRTLIWFLPYVLCIASVVGSTARTGIVTLLAYMGIKSLTFRTLLGSIPLTLVTVILLYHFAPEYWIERMTTITDTSGSQRLAVWKWTIDYASSHPVIGGGFNSFVANYGQLGYYDPAFINKPSSLAFHSIYFEVLGEQGYVGLFLFISLIFSAVRINKSLIKNMGTDQNAKDFCLAINHAIYIFCVGGAFIGVAYKPIIYHLIALSVAHYTIIYKELSENNKRAEKL